MISRTTERFRKAFEKLPTDVQHQAKVVFKKWKENPYYKSLHFKKVHATKPIYSIRIGIDWRAVCINQDENIVWFWIGSHAEYNKIISQL